MVLENRLYLAKRKKIVRANRSYILFVLIGLACGQKVEVQEADPETVRAELLPTQVQTVRVSYQPFFYVINSTGRIEAEWDLPVMATSSGIVKIAAASNGARIQKDQVLFELENERQQIQVERSRLAVEERKVAFQDMLLGHRGKRDSVSSKMVIENIRLGSGLAAAELAHREALLDYESTRLKAPQNGVLTDWRVQAGTFVTAGQALGRIFSPDRFSITCMLLEQDALRLTAQSVAELRVAGIDQPIVANRPEVNPRVDVKTNLVEVTFTVAGATKLLPGLSAQMTIRVPGQPALVVPKEAVVFRSGKPVVFSFENGLAKWNYVKTGSENGKEIEITEGLKENMMVITTNNLQLAHDAPVRQ